MSLRRETACDFGPCPYADMHSGYMNSCEYWCGAEEPEDYPEIDAEELEMYQSFQNECEETENGNAN